jgi:succinyl-CoA synthetase beta subunit
MALMRGYQVPVPAGVVATTPAEAEAAADRVRAASNKPSPVVVLKAQVLAGGRGRGTFSNGFKSGVHMITKKGQAAEVAAQMLGHRLITKQTGEEGKPTNSVYLMEGLQVARELYISIMLDRASSGCVIIASPSGGMSIEDVAAATPELISKELVELTAGPTPQQLDRLAAFMKFAPGSRGSTQFKDCVRGLWRMFTSTDATLIEINPVAETTDGNVFVCDAKINFDDNASFRQAQIFAQRDHSQEDVREVEAAKYDLNYIGLTGEIGCMVNGAGLAMATMDIIKLHGGTPANFLDVGGGATADQVTHAFELLNADNRVKAILVNIFGGIMKCDTIAEGIVQAAKHVGLKVPLVVRLEGTNVERGKKLIQESGLDIIAAADLDDAAKKAVAACQRLK